MRYAVKVAYDGRRFHGSQIQPGLRTVEGDFLDAAEKLGIVQDRSNFSRASRTDAGVSALGNVFVFESDFRNDAIVPALNSRLRDIRIRGIIPVSEDFNPRWATRRNYRYYLPYTPEFDVGRAKNAASLFRGTHDFSSYTRDRTKTPIIEIEEIMVKEGTLSLGFDNDAAARHDIISFLQIDISAQHFLWNMVRWMVGTIAAAGFGKIGEEGIRSSLGGASLPKAVKPARPDLLLLMDVEYGDAFRMTPLEVGGEDIFPDTAGSLFAPIFCALFGV